MRRYYVFGGRVTTRPYTQLCNFHAIAITPMGLPADVSVCQDYVKGARPMSAEYECVFDVAAATRPCNEDEVAAPVYGCRVRREEGRR